MFTIFVFSEFGEKFAFLRRSFLNSISNLLTLEKNQVDVHYIMGGQQIRRTSDLKGKIHAVTLNDRGLFSNFNMKLATLSGTTFSVERSCHMKHGGYEILNNILRGDKNLGSTVERCIVVRIIFRIYRRSSGSTGEIPDFGRLELRFLFLSSTVLFPLFPQHYS